jgi:hypothetical protein
MKKTFFIGMAILLVFSFFAVPSNTNKIAANDEPGPHHCIIINTIRA